MISSFEMSLEDFTYVELKGPSKWNGRESVLRGFYFTFTFCASGILNRVTYI